MTSFMDSVAIERETGIETERDRGRERKSDTERGGELERWRIRKGKGSRYREMRDTGK